MFTNPGNTPTYHTKHNKLLDGLPIILYYRGFWFINISWRLSLYHLVYFIPADRFSKNSLALLGPQFSTLWCCLCGGMAKLTGLHHLVIWQTRVIQCIFGTISWNVCQQRAYRIRSILHNLNAFCCLPYCFPLSYMLCKSLFKLWQRRNKKSLSNNAKQNRRSFQGSMVFLWQTFTSRFFDI